MIVNPVSPSILFVGTFRLCCLSLQSQHLLPFVHRHNRSLDFIRTLFEIRICKRDSLINLFRCPLRQITLVRLLWLSQPVDG